MKKIFSNIQKCNSNNFSKAMVACLPMFCALFLSGCASSSNNDVWNSYDYRNAPPGDSNDSYYVAPQGYGNDDSYQDNDDTYKPPIDCLPGSGDMCY